MDKDKKNEEDANVTLIAAKPLRSSLNKGSNTNKVGPSELDPTKVCWAEDDLSISLQPTKSENINKVPLTRKSSWTGTVVPTPEEIKKSKEIHRRVILNVGGERHEILWDNLERHPYTRLGQLKECQTHEETMDVCDDYLIDGNEYFWDRQPRSFALILNLYRKDKLHLPEDLCVMDFAEDLEYWGIDELFLDSCCQMKFSQKKEQLNEEIKKDEEFLFYHKEEEFGEGFLAEYRKYLWELFEKSDTLPQKITGFMSIFIIVLSIVTLSLSTVPQWHEYRCKLMNETLCNELRMEASKSADNSLPDEYFEVVEHEALDKLEIVCIVWFTCEYLIRLLAAPSKRKFFRGWLNNIDLLAIAPFYVSIFLVQIDTTGRLLQVLRVVRILRIFKLARHSTGLQSLGFTLRHSYQNLGVLLLFLTVGVVIFSTLAYFAENQKNQHFGSIPESFYWALITMTTVGYGDVTPITFWGKIIGMITGVCGVIVIALPIPIVVNNFGLFYEEQKRKEKAIKRQKDLQVLKESEQHTHTHGNYLKVTLKDPLALENKDKASVESNA